MTDQEFLARAENLLTAVELCCDQLNERCEVDIDNQRVGNMVTLMFANRSQIVVNLQPPLHEVWLATRAGGFHYKLHSGQWTDTKGGGEFFTQLSHCACAQSGLDLQFKAQ